MTNKHRMSANRSLRHRRCERNLNNKTYIGSTRPSPSVPNPVPSFHPINFNNLLPTLFSSAPGLTGGGGGDGGGGGPSTRFLPFPLLEELGSGRGISGWLCIIRRSEARSLYLGWSACGCWPPCAFCLAVLTFSRATSRRLGSL